MAVPVSQFEDKQYNKPAFDALVDELEKDIATPYVTIPTHDYARLVAAIAFFGGEIGDVIGPEPEVTPTFAPDPDASGPPLDHAAAKALQLMSWSKNGLNANDKAAYELLLRMTKTRPGQGDPHVRVNMSAVGARIGVSAKTAGKIVAGLKETGLIDTEHRRDDMGHTIVYARAGAMPAYHEQYRESSLRAKDARRKRVCQDCGGTKFKIRHVCTRCGCIQQEAPHSEELIDQLADTENTTKPIALTSNVSIEEELPEDREKPGTESVPGPIGNDRVSLLQRGWIRYIGPSKSG